MAKTEFATAFRNRMFPEIVSATSCKDPEYDDIIVNFGFDEVIREEACNMSAKDRTLAILATLMGCGGVEDFEMFLVGALEIGIEPDSLKELVYQGTPYLGLGRVRPFLKTINRFFDIRGIRVSDDVRTTVGADNRLAAGETIQVKIFGEGMKGYAQSGPKETRHIRKWLTSNCFGDYYTRKGLNLRQREFITFCFLMAQGGCEPQLRSHVQGNLRLGNDKTFLISMVSQCLPYIGYPRALNALTCIDEGALAYESSQQE